MLLIFLFETVDVLIIYYIGSMLFVCGLNNVMRLCVMLLNNFFVFHQSGKEEN